MTEITIPRFYIEIKEMDLQQKRDISFGLTFYYAITWRLAFSSQQSAVRNQKSAVSSQQSEDGGPEVSGH